MAPKEWPSSTLGQLLDAGDIQEIKDGNHGNDHPKTKDYLESGIPFVMAKDLVGGSIDFSKCAYISKEQADKLRTGFASTGDVLLSHKGTVGSVAIVPEGYEYVMLTPQVTYYRVSNKGRLNRQFLFYCFQEYGFQSWLKRLAFQSTRYYIGITEQKKRLRIPLPSLPEQQKIAAILSCWDSSVAVVEECLNQTKAQKKALMQQLLIGKRRLPGFDKDDWLEVRLEDLLAVRDEREIPSETCPLFSLTIENGITPKTARYNREALVRDKGGKKYKIVHPGDVVFNPSNLRWGAINISKVEHNVAVSPIYEVLFVRDQKATNRDFLAQLLMSPRQIERFAGMAEGTLIERTAVKLPVFNKVRISIPPSPEEQARLALILNICDIAILSLEEQRNRLGEEKNALMQQLLTGKRRIEVGKEAA